VFFEAIQRVTQRRDIVHRKEVIQQDKTIALERILQFRIVE
jgi:hypothetical protein